MIGGGVDESVARHGLSCPRRCVGLGGVARWLFGKKGRRKRGSRRTESWSFVWEQVQGELPQEDRNIPAVATGRSYVEQMPGNIKKEVGYFSKDVMLLCLAHFPSWNTPLT
jgi:hypothetical protein